MNKTLCYIKGHIRGEAWYRPWLKSWCIQCDRCGYEIEYKSPRARLVGIEIRYGFTGV